MRSLNTFNKIYLCREYVDFRKSIDGLAVIAEVVLKQNPLDGSLFVFICKDKRRVKILYWDKTGFALWYKRLEKAQFKYLPKYISSGDILYLTSEKLEWLLSGLDIFKMSPHEELKYESLC
jgi:transposase